MVGTRMPVGRFREDPRRLGDHEREIYARQYPEGLLVVGTLLGVGLRLLISIGVVSVPTLAGHALSVVGVLVGGVGGYLLGVAYRDRKLRAVRAARSGGDPTVPEDPEANPASARVPSEHRSAGEE